MSWCFTIGFCEQFIQLKDFISPQRTYIQCSSVKEQPTKIYSLSYQLTCIEPLDQIHPKALPEHKGQHA